VIDPLPSYGRGRDAAGGRFISLIFGTNLTDVIITGINSSIVICQLMTTTKSPSRLRVRFKKKRI